MTIHTYRYQWLASLSDADLVTLTGDPGVTTLGHGNVILTDIQIDSAFLPDLDDIMESRGYSRIAIDPVTTVSQAAANTITHANLTGLSADDHTQYQLRTEKGAANGYAALDAGSTIGDAQHGSRSGGTLHAIATTLSAGFLSASDKTKLDGVASGAAAVSSTAPANVTKAAAAVGTATDAARADHKHDVATAAAVSVGSANAEGTATTLARSDHTHKVADFSFTGQAQGDVLYFNGTNWTNLPAGTAGQVLQTQGAAANPTWTNATTLTASAPADVDKSAAVVGVATTAARADHKHNIATAAAVAVGATNAEGTATTLARSDHTHQVTNLAIASQAQGDVLYYNGTSWVRLAAGTSGQFLQTQGTGANPQWASTTALTSSSPANIDKSAAVVGVATTAARADHKHDVNTAAAVAVGTLNAEGTATTLARSDHTHQVTGLTISGQVQGDVLYFNGTSWVRLAPGTSGQFLQTQGAAANPTWASTVALTSSVTPQGIDVGDAAIIGTSTEAARADHQHALPTPAAPADITKAAASAGTSTTVARADHKHDVTTAAAVAVGTANAEGTATTLARSDHTHQVTGLVITGQTRGDILYFNGTAWVRFAPGTAGLYLQTQGSGADPVWSNVIGASLASTTPANVDKSAASVGVGATAARADHKHDISTAAVVTIGTANAEGTATTLARSDHVHNHGNQAGGTLHAVATSSVAGFMSATDKTNLDALVTGAAQLIAHTESDAAASTTSATFTNKATITQSFAAGTYMVLGTIQMTGTTGSTVIESRVFQDNTTTLYLQAVSTPSGSTAETATSWSFATLTAGSHTFTIDFRRSGGSGTAKVQYARLAIFKVG